MTLAEFKAAICADNRSEIARGCREMKSLGMTNAQVFAVAQEALEDLTSAEWCQVAREALASHPETPANPLRAVGSN